MAILDRRILRAAVLLILSGTAGCTSLLGDFNSAGPDGSASDATTTDGPAEATTGSDATTDTSADPLGKPCTGPSQCNNSETCTDGVCCATACDGVCEKCNLPGSLGTCTPIPKDTDPDKECVMTAQPDAGSDAATGPSDGSAEAGDAGDASGEAGGDAAISDAATADAPAADAQQLATPDGGLAPDNAKCAGSCDGQRKCQYPDKATSCGQQFCASRTEQDELVCDGTGRCSLGTTDCATYSCVTSASCGTGCTGKCAATCQTASDCAPSAFCNSLSACQAKKGTGVECSNKNECALGHCNDGYCCNTECSSIPGGKCDLAGSPGECKCSINCGDGGACQAYYRDRDGDGHGDPVTIQAFCAGTTTPGWVTNNDDCDDNDANTHPGQTAWFTSPRPNGTFEYNCVSPAVPQFPVYERASCGFCGSSTPCSIASTTCANVNDQSYLNCTYIFGFCTSRFCRPGFCLGTEVDDNGTSYAEAFTSPTACGQSGPFLYCGTCAAASGSPYSSSYSRIMPCH